MKRKRKEQAVLFEGAGRAVPDQPIDVTTNVMPALDKAGANSAETKTAEDESHEEKSDPAVPAPSPAANNQKKPLLSLAELEAKAEHLFDVAQTERTQVMAPDGTVLTERRRKISPGKDERLVDVAQSLHTASGCGCFVTKADLFVYDFLGFLHCLNIAGHSLICARCRQRVGRFAGKYFRPTGEWCCKKCYGITRLLYFVKLPWRALRAVLAALGGSK